MPWIFILELESVEKCGCAVWFLQTEALKLRSEPAHKTIEHGTVNDDVGNAMVLDSSERPVPFGILHWASSIGKMPVGDFSRSSITFALSG